MKRLLLISLILSALLLPPSPTATAQSAFTYALIGDNAILYRASTEGYIPLTSLPKDYFVLISGEEHEGYIPVRYHDIDGFVTAQSVTLVDYEPKSKYALKNSLTLVNDGMKINLRSTPSHSENNILLTLDSGDMAYYYGTVKGSTQISALGDEWYYIKVVRGENITRGYIYNLYADATPIENNIIERVEHSDEGEEREESLTSVPLSSAREIIIIVSLCLPALVGLYLLFRQR